MRSLQILHIGNRFLTISSRYLTFQNRLFSQDVSEANLFSALYVATHYNDKVYPVLRPDLDYEFVVNNWDAIRRSASMRGLSLKEFSWTTEELAENIRQLKELDLKVKNTVELLARNKKSNNSEDQLAITTELQTLKDKYWCQETVVIPLLLKRPNLLNPESGTERKVIRKCGNNNLGHIVENHVDFGLKKKWLFYPKFSPGVYYMLDKLAKLEFCIINYFRNTLQCSGFRSISAPNIVQTAILEATGRSRESTIQLKGKKQGLVQEYLVGSSSLEALAAQFTRMIVSESTLPIRLSNTGRHYSSTSDASSGLYDTNQSTQIQCLTVCKPNDIDTLFGDTVNLLQQTYGNLDIPHQVVVVSAKELNLTETIRIQIEIWSPFLQRYVPCAKVSQHSDFLSKRLRMQYKQSGTLIYVHCLSAMMVSVPILVASLIENRPEEEFSIPTVLQPFSP